MVDGRDAGILAGVHFQGATATPTSRGTDKVRRMARRLVAGGIAAKAGFFKLLWVGILAFRNSSSLRSSRWPVSSRSFWARIRGRGPTTESFTVSDRRHRRRPAA